MEDDEEVTTGAQLRPASPKRLSQIATAKRLRVSTRTLANWRWRKYGPPFLKYGRLIEYLEEDVEAWRLSQRRDPAA